MTTEQKLQKLRDKIDEALIAQGLDGTRELVFGCKFKWKANTKYFDGQYTIVDTDEDIYIAVHKQRVRDIDDVAKFDDRIKTEKEFEIIGRDITPLDIVRILPLHWMVKYVRGNFEIVNMRDYGTKQFKNEYITLKDLPIHLQSPETISFLYKLIVKEDE